VRSCGVGSAVAVLGQVDTAGANTVSLGETHPGPIRALKESTHLGRIGHLDLRAFGPMNLRCGISQRHHLNLAALPGRPRS
jgi:hypothetical protein